MHFTTTIDLTPKLSLVVTGDTWENRLEHAEIEGDRDHENMLKYFSNSTYQKLYDKWVDAAWDAQRGMERGL